MKKHTVLIKTSDTLLHLSKQLSHELRSSIIFGEPKLPKCLQAFSEVNNDNLK